MKLIRFLLLLLAAIIPGACSESPMTYRFIGDSLVTRWDLQSSFPTLITSNCGKSGSGIEHLQAYAGKCEGQTVSVMSGTNNCHTLSTRELCEAYAREYVDALEAFGAGRVYVFSILPRHFQGKEEAQANANIRMMNECIRTELAGRSNSTIVYLDVYHEFLDKDGKLNVNLSYDGLHLNPEGYEILTDKLNKEIL